MAELADALDLGSSPQGCRFNSCYPHHNKRIKMIFYIIIFLVVIVFTVLTLILTSTGIKGKVGEKLVRKNLKKLITEESFLINNVIFLIDNKTYQIDHIFLSTKGVVLIETKNYSGRIYGNDEQIKWTQVLNFGKVKNHFYNPVKQNNSHIYAIKKILNINSPIIPVVVFVKNNTENIVSDRVIGLCQLKEFIQNLPQKISLDEVKEIYKLIENNNKADIVTNKDHVKNIKKEQINVKNNICPRCGSNLVLRNGKYGKFYGCENYPKCKFIKKFD